MQIITPIAPESISDALYEDVADHDLLSSGVSWLHASIGQPVQWPENVLLGDNWKAPVGGYHYYLVRFAFTIRSVSVFIKEVYFCLTLEDCNGKQGMIFDAYPLEQLEDASHPVTLGISPSFKFGTTELSLAQASTTIDFGHAIPVITSEGLQESVFCWHYREGQKHSLQGSRLMYAVIAVPPDVSALNVHLELRVEFTNAQYNSLMRLLHGRFTVEETSRTCLIGNTDLQNMGDGNIEWDYLQLVYPDDPILRDVKFLPGYTDIYRPSYQEDQQGMPIYIASKKDDLTSANIIAYYYGTDNFIPMLRLGSVSDYGIWGGAVPPDVHYYRIQVNDRLCSAYLKADNSDGKAYLNPRGQWVRRYDVPDRDNYEISRDAKQAYSSGTLLSQTESLSKRRAEAPALE